MWFMLTGVGSDGSPYTSRRIPSGAWTYTSFGFSVGSILRLAAFHLASAAGMSFTMKPKWLTMAPAGGSRAASVLRSMMYTPGNWMSSSGPFVTSVPPIMPTQNCLWASTSFTTRCTWPIRRPTWFGSTSCAKAGEAHRTPAARRAKKSIHG